MKYSAFWLKAIVMIIVVLGTSFSVQSQTYIENIQCANQYSSSTQQTDSGEVSIPVHVGFAVGVQFSNNLDSTFSTIEIKIGTTPGSSSQFSQEFQIDNPSISWISDDFAVLSMPLIYVNPDSFVQIKVSFSTGHSNILIKQL